MSKYIDYVKLTKEEVGGQTMKSNEDYLDELLKSMNQDTAENSPLTRFGLESEIEEEASPAPAMDVGMGKMDQAMIDALLAGAAADDTEVESADEATDEKIEIGDSVDELDAELKDQFAIYEESEYETMPEIEETSMETQIPGYETMPEIEETSMDV